MLPGESELLPALATVRMFECHAAHAIWTRPGSRSLKLLRLGS